MFDFEELKSMSKKELNEKIRECFGEEVYQDELFLDKLNEEKDELCERLGIDNLPIIFEDIEEDSRIYIQDFYIGISNKYKGNFIECMKCIIHEARHMFQIYAALTLDFEFAKKWKKLLKDGKGYNKQNVNNDYYNSELELDAFAYTEYYMETYLNKHIEYPNEEYEKMIREYIKIMPK